MHTEKLQDRTVQGTENTATVVPKLVSEAFRERVGLKSVLDSGGQKAFQEVRVSGKITAKKFAKFLEIEVGQEKQGERCYGSVNVTKDLNDKAKKHVWSLTLNSVSGAGKEPRISVATDFQQISNSHSQAIHSYDG